MLQVDHICKSFSSHQVLSDITFSVDAGEAVALLGGNGAGKTTLLRIVTGLLQPDSGQVLYCGHPMRPADLSEVGYLPEERGLYRNMRCGEQAIYFARLKGLDRDAADSSVHAWFERLGMSEWWNRPASRLSKGMQQRLQFVAAVAHNPSLLILDEPFSGFDAANAAMLETEISRLRQSGTAVLISTHNIQAAGSLCSKTVQL